MTKKLSSIRDKAIYARVAEMKRHVDAMIMNTNDNEELSHLASLMLASSKMILSTIYSKDVTKEIVSSILKENEKED